ncbi:MAG: hypothetical protein N2248_07010 [candidate division WOR-3 bacterium]|nr:hypothetical protein [candidate division WOR-3 bacterium]
MSIPEPGAAEIRTGRQKPAVEDEEHRCRRWQLQGRMRSPNEHGAGT